MQQSLEFLIVGSPRSGTTLAQRLASEISGVCVPRETHFFVHRRRDIRRALIASKGPLLRSASRLKPSEADLAAGRPGLPKYSNPVDMLEAVLRHNCRSADIMGEKTPGHLAWWRAITSWRTDLLFVVIVRDPRATITSQREMPWSRSSLHRLALEWAADQSDAMALASRRPGRTLVIRYEDLIARPGEFQEQLASTLGIAKKIGHIPAGSLFDESEWWKGRAHEDIDVSRRDRWKSVLKLSEIERIESIVRPEMMRLGYRPVSREKRVSPIRLLKVVIMARRRFREQSLRILTF